MTVVVFIVGTPRSRTSVVAKALGRHPRILATEELHYHNLLRPQAEDDALWLGLRLPRAMAMAYYYLAGGIGDLINAVRQRFL